eukprot:SAG31_NODE_135_length_23206_cov_25.707967_9_plen_411_part_00
MHRQAQNEMGLRKALALCILVTSYIVWTALHWSSFGSWLLETPGIVGQASWTSRPTATAPIHLGVNATQIVARLGPEPVRWKKLNKDGRNGRPEMRLSHTNGDPELWPRPDDIWLVSYPKSGQTWLRFLLGNLLAFDSKQPIDFDTVESRFPFLEDGSESWISWAFLASPSPRIFKSHQPLILPQPTYPCNKKQTSRSSTLKMSKVQCLCPNCASKFRKILYVLRDGRDVMWSYLKFRWGLGQYHKYNLTGFLDPATQLYPGPLWHEHAHSWLGRGPTGCGGSGCDGAAGQWVRPDGVSIMLVRYEDMLQNATHELLRAAKFVGLPVDKPRIQWAVEQSAAESMRRIEKQKGHGFFEKKYSNAIQHDFKFVQGANVGGWRNVYTVDDKRLFKSYAGQALIDYGYATDVEW